MVCSDTQRVTLLEARFPFREVSRVVAADRRAPDSGYGAHRWWARRPPALVRALLLAGSMPADAPPNEFWAAYRSDGEPLAGLTAVDTFMGGGTTLLEAARLGADVVGCDVDPLAVMISAHQLGSVDAGALQTAGDLLADYLAIELGGLWPAPADGWEPLHYFSVALVTCPACDVVGPLYRSLVLARSVGKKGSVTRDVAASAFCPDCFGLHELKASASTVTCCQRRRRLDSASFSGTRFTCSSCGVRSSHQELQTGVAPRQVLAVEETPVDGGRRRIRAPRGEELTAAGAGAKTLAAYGTRAGLDAELAVSAGDARPLSFGVRTLRDLHTDRQVAYLSEAFGWVESNVDDADVARALKLAVSTTVTCNNRLCGYATDYGRLAPLFSIRAFALPWLTVELNPLNETGGRGTFSAALSRVVRSAKASVRRNVIDESGAVSSRVFNFSNRTGSHALTCADVTEPGFELRVPGAARAPVLCVTDPPYFDFIAYDALSQVFRGWLGLSLAGESLHPPEADGAAVFGARLAAAFAAVFDGSGSDALLAFTYKGDEEAWDAVGVALDEAKLRVTALWPVLADPHMGHHTHAGNCEFDLVVVARPGTVTDPAVQPTGASDRAVGQLARDREVSVADRANIGAAYRMASSRWGALAEPELMT